MTYVNTLYCILTNDLDTAGQNTTPGDLRAPIELNMRSTAIRNIIQPPLAANRDLLCRMICWQAVTSRFRDEILQHDPLNTYRKPERPADVLPTWTKRDGVRTAANTSVIYSDLLPQSDYRKLAAYLDEDIKDQLSTPLWEDLAAAAALQLLRGV